MNAVSTPTHDLIIVGAGLAGLIQYHLLKQAGFAPLLVDGRSLDAVLKGNEDRRSTALTALSVETLDLPLDWLEAEGSRIEEMLVDGGLSAALQSDESLRLKSGAWVVPNAALKAWLVEGLAEGLAEGLDGHFGAGLVDHRLEGGRRRVSLDDGTSLDARLLIAADGKASAVRRGSGIQKHVRDFQQRALTGVIAHSQPHGNRAFQRFLPGGTLAFLPLPGQSHQSSFIWVEPRTRALDFFALPPAVLAERMQARFGDALGVLTAPEEALWGQYPLTAHHCDTIVGERLALMGEAAHSLHPLAGQGLNLSIKDAQALTAALVAQRRAGLDLGDAEGLRAYERARRGDTARLTGLTTALHDVFDRGPAPVRALAAAGLRVVDRMAPLKAFLERQANR